MSTSVSAWVQQKQTCTQSTPGSENTWKGVWPLSGRSWLRTPRFTGQTPSGSCRYGTAWPRSQAQPAHVWHILLRLDGCVTCTYIMAVVFMIITVHTHTHTHTPAHTRATHTHTHTHMHTHARTHTNTLSHHHRRTSPCWKRSMTCGVSSKNLVPMPMTWRQHWT